LGPGEFLVAFSTAFLAEFASPQQMVLHVPLASLGQKYHSCLDLLVSHKVIPL